LLELRRHAIHDAALARLVRMAGVDLYPKGAPPDTRGNIQEKP